MTGAKLDARVATVSAPRTSWERRAWSTRSTTSGSTPVLTADDRLGEERIEGLLATRRARAIARTCATSRRTAVAPAGNELVVQQLLAEEPLTQLEDDMVRLQLSIFGVAA